MVEIDSMNATLTFKKMQKSEIFKNAKNSRNKKNLLNRQIKSHHFVVQTSIRLLNTIIKLVTIIVDNLMQGRNIQT